MTKRLKPRAVTVRLDPKQAELIRLALLAYDGPSLRPDWEPETRKELTAALDELRLQLTY